MQINSNKLVYPELSYKIVGILYKKEIEVDLTIDGEKIGKYYLDFLIDGKIVLELKAKPVITKVDYRQIRAYLQSCKLKLGILANFHGASLEYWRILNSTVANIFE
ncbi:GxxExxY protein [Candidatus Microgenomates bacterium]|nr:GxxExxY protein [Candidatus Microgenomates bacterium]